MMGRLARATRAAGGHTVGVIPVALRGREVADLDADELVETQNMRERKGIMDERSDAFLDAAEDELDEVLDGAIFKATI